MATEAPSYLGNPTDRQRLLLATIAAYGILNHNTAVEIPDEFSEHNLQDKLPSYASDARRSDLDRLTGLGLLRRRNTGHGGYGNTWVEGIDVWSITASGLLALWGCVAP